MPPIEPVKSTVLVGADIPMATPSEPAAEPSGVAAPEPVPAKTRSAGKAEKPEKTKSKSPTLSVLSILVTLATALSLFTAVIGCYKLLGMARSYVAGQDRFQVPVREIEITPLPVWIRDDLLA